MSVRSTIAWGGIIAGAILPGIQWACLAATEEASPASAVAAPFNDDSNPYSVITGRNVFHLNPPPPPPSTQKEKPPELPKVMLSGLPLVSGFELLAEWRGDARTVDLPIFILTSKDLTPLERDYLSAKSSSLLHKHEQWQEALFRQLHRAVPPALAENS